MTVWTELVLAIQCIKFRLAPMRGNAIGQAFFDVVS